MSSGGSGRLNRSCLFGLVARLFHKGDGENSGGSDIGHGAAGDRPDQGAGNHGGNGWSSSKPTACDESYPVEETGRSGGAEKRAEDDKQKDVVGADGKRSAV